MFPVDSVVWDKHLGKGTVFGYKEKGEQVFNRIRFPKFTCSRPDEMLELYDETKHGQLKPKFDSQKGCEMPPIPKPSVKKVKQATEKKEVKTTKAAKSTKPEGKVSLGEVARRLNKSRNQVFRMITKGELPADKDGPHWWISEKDIDKVAE